MQRVTGYTWADVGAGTYLDDLAGHTWRATSATYDAARAVVVVDLVDAGGDTRTGVEVPVTRPVIIWANARQAEATAADHERTALSVASATLGGEVIKETKEMQG